MASRVLRGIVVLAMCVAPSAALGATTSRVVPNVVHLEAGTGVRIAGLSGASAIARFTINCPQLGANAQLIAFQSPPAGTKVERGMVMRIVVAVHGMPKARRSEPLPRHLSRAGLCASVSR